MTVVSGITPVVNLDIGYACRQSEAVRAVDAFLARAAEVMASKKFKSERAWCAAAGVDESYIAVVRNRGPKGTGEVVDLKTEKIVKLARAAGVEPGWLMGVDLQTLQAAPSRRSTLDDAIAAFDWPPDLTAAQAADVVARAKDEGAGLAELPVKFWLSRLAKLAEEARTGPSARSRTRRVTGAAR